MHDRFSSDYTVNVPIQPKPHPYEKMALADAVNTKRIQEINEEQNGEIRKFHSRSSPCVKGSKCNNT